MFASRIALFLVLAFTPSIAGVADDVRNQLARNDFAAAEAELQTYRNQHGVTPDYLEGLSWMARASLKANRLDRADTFARQTETLSRQLLLKRALDAEPQLPIALGAALEVQAQALASQGKQAQAVALLRRSVATYGNTSIQATIAEKPQSAGLDRAARATDKGRTISRSQAVNTRPAQRIARPALFLGTLVRRLQGRRAGDRSVEIRIRTARLDPAGTHSTLRLRRRKGKMRSRKMSWRTSNASGNTSIRHCRMFRYRSAKKTSTCTAPARRRRWFW